MALTKLLVATSKKTCLCSTPWNGLTDCNMHGNYSCVIIVVAALHIIIAEARYSCCTDCFPSDGTDTIVASKEPTISTQADCEAACGPTCTAYEWRSSACSLYNYPYNSSLWKMQSHYRRPDASNSLMCRKTGKFRCLG